MDEPGRLVKRLGSAPRPSLYGKVRGALYLCRELLASSGSVFVQISDENVHRIVALMDEVFGAANRCSLISFAKTSGQESNSLATVCDYLVWYAKDRESTKYRQLYRGLGTDVSDASRPIKQKEIDACREGGVEFIEIPVAYDGLAVMVNKSNTWVESLTTSELKTIWDSEAQGVVTDRKSVV